MNDKGCCQQGTRPLRCKNSQTRRTYLLPQKVEARKTPHRRAKMSSPFRATKEKKDNGRSKGCGKAKHLPAHSGAQISKNSECQSQSRSLAFPSSWGTLLIGLAVPRLASPHPLSIPFFCTRPSEARKLRLACEGDWWGVGGQSHLLALGSSQGQEILPQLEQAMDPPRVRLGPAWV